MFIEKIGNPLPEHLITFENEGAKLFGVLHEPNKDVDCEKSIVIIFLHGWAGYRIGPHRMFVKLARSLTKQGYWCFRFDFRGRGYSEGHHENTTPMTMLSDLQMAIRFLEKTIDSPRFILLGICSGARIAILGSGFFPKINQIIALSSISIWEQSSIHNELKRTQSVVRSYFNKVSQIETWRKIFTFQIQWSLIYKILSRPFIRYFKNINNISYKSGVDSTSSNRNITVNIQKIVPLAGFNGECLFIHGEKDPETTIALTQLTALCQLQNIAHEVHIIPGANHSFYSLEWEDEVFRKIKEWLSD